MMSCFDSYCYADKWNETLLCIDESPVPLFFSLGKARRKAEERDSIDETISMINVFMLNHLVLYNVSCNLFSKIYSIVIED